MTTRRVLEIVNVKGLHARASAKFVDTVERFDASATIHKDGIDADGDSIMGLLMLGAAQGTTISVETSGAQAVELLEALTKLVADKFDEGM
jgi:phosphocarrier protein